MANGASWRPLPARLDLVRGGGRRARTCPGPRRPLHSSGPALPGDIGPTLGPRGGLARSSPATVAPPCAHRRASARTARDTQAPRAQGRLGAGHHARFPSVPCFSWAAPPLIPPPCLASFCLHSVSSPRLNLPSEGLEPIFHIIYHPLLLEHSAPPH